MIGVLQEQLRCMERIKAKLKERLVEEQKLKENVQQLRNGIQRLEHSQHTAKESQVCIRKSPSLNFYYFLIIKVLS